MLLCRLLRFWSRMGRDDRVVLVEVAGRLVAEPAGDGIAFRRTPR